MSNSIRLERVGRAKLTQGQYEALCRLLACIRPGKFTVGLGRVSRSPTSQRALAARFGISQSRVSRIAREVREGRASRAYGVRCMAVTSQARFVARAVANPTPGALAILRPGPGRIWDAVEAWVGRVTPRPH